MLQKIFDILVRLSVLHNYFDSGQQKYFSVSSWNFQIFQQNRSLHVVRKKKETKRGPRDSMDRPFEH